MTVVVDFAELGGEVVAGCAPSPASGFDALAQAGFDTTVVLSDPGFICRIDGLPDAGTEDCADTPPANASWSYWTAELGGAWTYSSTGAAGPVTGDLEGWSFSTGTALAPRFTVPRAPTTTTSAPTTTTSMTSSTTSSTTSTTLVPSTPDTTTTTPTASTATLYTPPAAPTTTTTATTTPATATSHTVPAVTTLTTVTSVTSSTVTTAPAAGETAVSGPVGMIVGGALIGALTAAGLVVARRRGPT